MMIRVRLLQRGLMWGIGGCLVASAVLRVGAHAEAAVAATETPGEAIAPMACPQPPAEIARALLQREAALRTREAELTAEATRLDGLRKQVEAQVSQMQSAEVELRKTISLAEGAAERDVQQLTEIYQAMKPKDAAALFNGMDPQFAAGFLGRMRPADAAGILAGMDPGTAYAISALLAGRNTDVPRQ
jgi:flagellar motility protein MotE (MotC chaperone)